MKNIVIKKCVLIIMSIALLLSGCSSGKEPGVTDFNGTYYVDEYTAYRFDGTGEGALCLGEETEYIFHYAVAKDILFIDFEDEGASDVKYVAAAVEFTAAMLLGTVCYLFAPQIIGIFSSNPEVIAAGVKYTGTMAYLYLFAFFGEIIQSFFRGLGRLRLTMIASLLQVVIRVILSYLLVPRWGIAGICVSVATGWILLNIIEGVYSLKKVRQLTKA